MRIDLNSDLGESFGNYVIGHDDQVLTFVSSANIACGCHAGDPLVMDQTVQRALKKGVSIGAHPGYPDLAGFGRRSMGLSPNEIRAYTLYQIGALRAFVEAHGSKLAHVKPHGALYNRAAVEYETARAVVEAILRVDDSLILLGLPFSEMERAAKDVGVPFACEAFADRAYTKEGRLLARNVPGAVIHDPDEVVSRVLRMVREGKVKSIEGVDIKLRVDSICLHGDNKEAVALARALRKGLIAAGVEIRSLRGE